MFAFTPKDRRTNGKKIYIVIKFTCKTAYAVCIRRRKGISRETRTKQRKVPFSRVLSESFVSLVFFLVPRETRQKYICLLAGKPLESAATLSSVLWSRRKQRYRVLLGDTWKFYPTHRWKTRDTKGRPPFHRQSYCVISVENTVVMPAICMMCRHQQVTN